MPRVWVNREGGEGWTAVRRCTICQGIEGSAREDGTTVEFYASANSWCKRCASARRASQPRVNRAARRAQRNARRFGVELEFVGQSYRVAQEMQARGLQCQNEHYNHDARSYWKIVPDTSVRGGAELVSPPLQGAEGERQVKLACEALKAAGATVNRTTGLHVHIDAVGLSVETLRRVAFLYQQNVDLIDTLVAVSRRAGRNSYCGAFSATDISRINLADRPYDLRACERYRNVNFQALVRHGTVEFRQHQGTIESPKVLAWVGFLQAIVRTAAAGPAFTASTRQELFTGLGLSTQEAQYLESRAAALQTAAERRARRMAVR